MGGFGTLDAPVVQLVLPAQQQQPRHPPPMEVIGEVNLVNPLFTAWLGQGTGEETATLFPALPRNS